MSEEVVDLTPFKPDAHIANLRLHSRLRNRRGSHRRSSLLETSRMPKSSKAYKPQFGNLEKSWDSRFHVKFSRFNTLYHRNLREYFDRSKAVEANPFLTLAQKVRATPATQEFKRIPSSQSTRKHLWKRPKRSDSLATTRRCTA